jgi:hypothetical protein
MSELTIERRRSTGPGRVAPGLGLLAPVLLAAALAAAATALFRPLRARA